MPTAIDVIPSTLMQYVAVMNGFVIKPTYMLLTLFLLWRLRRDGGRQTRFLWWGLFFFLLGESACAYNYLFFQLESVAWEMVHNVGMVVAFALIGFAALEFVDCRILFASVPDKPCGLLRFCRGCPKAGTQPDCNLKFIYKLLVSFWMLVALYPLSKPFTYKPVNFQVFGDVYAKSHQWAYQFFETRFCPVLGLCMLLITFVLLFCRSERLFHISRWTFAIGLACVGFGFVRAGIFHGNLDNLIMMDFWEEATELAFVLGLVLLTWRFPKLLLESNAKKEAVRG